VFITRTYVKELNSFYTTSFSILKNKKQRTYEVLFEEIKKNAKKNNNIIITIKNFHCDFEKSISNAVKKVFPDINIKYYIWHYKRVLKLKKKKKNKLCRKKVENDIDLYIHYKFISNFPFINHEYINYIYNKIKSKCLKNKYDNFFGILRIL